MIQLRITPDGHVHGLWSDEVNLLALGPVRVRRASYVEFDDHRQCWIVREARPRSTWCRFAQLILRRPMGRVLYRAASRAEALAWEREYFRGGDVTRRVPP